MRNIRDAFSERKNQGFPEKTPSDMGLFAENNTEKNPSFLNERIFTLIGSEQEEEIQEKVEETQADTVVFLVPRKCTLLLEMVKWQKIRDFCDEKGKTMIVVSRDPEGREKLQSLGISVFATLEDREQTPFSKAREHYEPKKIIKRSIDRFFRKTPPLQKTEEFLPKKDFFARPSLHALFLFLFFGIVLSFFILTIALPEATVKISPRKEESEEFLNLKFFSSTHSSADDLWKENNSLLSYPIEEVFVLEENFSHVTKEYKGELSKGKFVLHNFSENELTLQKNTRVQNQDGVIFHLPHWVTLPAAKNGVASETIIVLSAAEKDASGRIQGEKANLPKGQSFFLPGLSDDLKDIVNAQNIENTEGGRAEWVFRITKEDVERAKKKLEEHGYTRADEELSYALEKHNTEKGTDWVLLPTGSQKKVEVMSIWVDESLIGKSQETFSGKIRLRIKNFAYSQKDLLSILNTHFEKKSPEGMELKRVDENTIFLETLKVFSAGEIIKVSVVARGVFQYVIEPKSAKGLEFIEKAQNSINSLPQKQAEEILMNDFKEVEAASIEMWPIWVSDLPRLPERIRFELEEK